MNCSIWTRGFTVFKKELACGFRDRADLLTMFLFAFTVLACISMSLGGVALEANVAAALLWVIVFFSALTGMGQIFRTELLSGTLLSLRVYGRAQEIFLGKFLYSVCLLLFLSLFTLSLFLMLFQVTVNEFSVLFLTVFFGIFGLAGAGTLTAALSASASGQQSGLFAGLLLPLVLPVLLPAISLTAAIFGTGEADISFLFGIIGYDGAMLAGSSILFDYVWEGGI